MTSYLVLGGGISGLAAADEILRTDPTADVTLLEGADRVGGKVRGETVAGCRVDVGAEAVLARRPEALDLIARAGLTEDVVHPTPARSQVWSRGQLHPLPPRTLMGVPAEPELLRGLLTDAEVDRARHEVDRPPHDGNDPRGADGEGTDHLGTHDISVAQLVTERLGPAVTERLVEPLLGGVYAGHADLLSARAALPQLLAAAGAGRTLTETVAELLPAPTDGTQIRSSTPVFATLTGGLHRLPEQLSPRLQERGARVLTGTIARELHRDDRGFTVVTGPRPSPTAYRADRVVLAVPAAPAARLLTDLAPDAARELGTIETASVAVITAAFPADALGDLGGSGFLVPPVDGRTVKAATFSAAKWDWVREEGRGRGPGGSDLALLRASIGRHREAHVLQVPDHDLVLVALAELAEALGRPLPAPVGTHVQRWGGGLPQYAVGHLGRIDRVRAALAEVPGLTACGAAYDGVGIPACIASARRAVAELVAAPPTMGA